MSGYQYLFTLDADEKWALGCDRLQWMIMKAKKRRIGSAWEPVRFIASRKATMLLTLAEIGVQLTSEAQAILDTMPDTFREWHQQRQDAA